MIRHPHLLHGAALLAVVLVAGRVALADEVGCPAMITTPVATAAVPGWTVVPRPSPTGFPFRGVDAPGRKTFEGVTIVDGGPEDVTAEAPGSLVPDESALRDGRLRQRWDLSEGSPRGFLMVCRYQATATVLFRVLDATVRECIQILPRHDTLRAQSAICH